MKVDFFIAGVQKSGTTALDTFLRRHPQIQMANVKEVHLFDDENIDWTAPTYDKLHACFDWTAPNVLRGEATPIYTYWPNALLRLQNYNPDAKIVIGLRHPSYRAFSHWRMETSRGADTMSFSEAIRGGRSRVSTAPDRVHRVYSYVERGFYGDQLARLLSVVPPERVHCYRTDWLWTRRDETLRDIQTFLGVEPLTLSLGEYIVPIKSDEVGVMSREDTEYLHALYSDDIHVSSHRSGCNLTDWDDPDYIEPMRHLD